MKIGDLVQRNIDWLQNARFPNGYNYRTQFFVDYPEQRTGMIVAVDNSGYSPRYSVLWADGVVQPTFTEDELALLVSA